MIRSLTDKHVIGAYELINSEHALGTGISPKWSALSFLSIEEIKNAPKNMFVCVDEKNKVDGVFWCKFVNNGEYMCDLDMIVENIACVKELLEFLEELGIKKVRIKSKNELRLEQIGFKNVVKTEENCICVAYLG